MTKTAVMVSVYASTRREEMYLFMPKDTGFDELPEAMQRSFGKPRHVMDLLLRHGIKLARAEVEQVLADIHEQGFYLQMPPRPEVTLPVQGRPGDA
jgi:uncharacterized protein YcgL (UPF0745 family)